MANAHRQVSPDPARLCRAGSRRIRARAGSIQAVTDELVPWDPSRPGCGAGVRGNEGRWIGCEAKPVAAGTRRFQHTPREQWRTYACQQHRGWLDNPRPLTPEDRDDMAWRREQHELALAGHPHTRVRPLPR